MEYRYLQTALRAIDEDDDYEIEGYAALYDNESKDLGGFREVIQAGAFTRSIKARTDVKCLVNHDSNMILGRVGNGTLKIEADSMGLRFRCNINREDTQAMSLAAKIKRGDINECSFAFTVPKGGDRWAQKQMPGSNGAAEADFYALRTLTDVNLLDVSAVTYPAYGNTSVRKHFDDFAEVRSSLAAAKANGALPILELDVKEIVARNEANRNQFFADLQDRARNLRGERPLQPAWKPSLR